MKSKVTGCLLFGLALVLTLTISARPRRGDDDRDNRNGDQQECRDVEHNTKAPLQAIGVVELPGKPLTSSDIAWVDPGTERFYLADRSNSGVDVIDAENDTWVGRVLGFAGVTPAGNGPNGVLVTPSRTLWAGDAPAKVQAADVDPGSPNYLKIVRTVDVSTPACNDGKTNNCNRADEVGFDPKDHKVLAAIDQPNSAATAMPIAPYAALINTNTYGVQFVTIPNITIGGGLEQPLWDGELSVFFLTVPSVGNPASGSGEIAIINPKTGVVKGSYATPGCGPTGEVLAPFQRLVVECGGKLLILNAHTGELITTVPGVPADELWFNSGDDLVYSASGGTLYVVDPHAGAVIQMLDDPGGRNQAAFAENNHVFTPVRAATPPAADQCSKFGFVGTGCVAVFEHVESESGGR
jgi:hypothetical protein